MFASLIGAANGEQLQAADHRVGIVSGSEPTDQHLAAGGVWARDSLNSSGSRGASPPTLRKLSENVPRKLP